MIKTIAIFGATGQQGSSVLNFILNSPSLCSQYAPRAITRDLTKPASQALLARCVEVVQADADTPSTLVPALKDAHTVFIVTTTNPTSDLQQVEFAQGKAIADAAVAAGAQYLIFSTEVDTDGRVQIFDTKARIEKYIRSLPVQSAFFVPGVFMQNLCTSMAPRPTPARTQGGQEGEFEYAIMNIMKPGTKLPFIDIAADTGKWVGGTILSDPEKYAGRMVYAASGLYSFTQVVQIISGKSGKAVQYVQVPEEAFLKFMPAGMGEMTVEMMRFFETDGYFGPGTEALLNGSIEGVKEVGLKNLEEFVEESVSEIVQG